MCPAAADWARRREELFACALELMQSNSPTPTTDHSPGVWVEGCGLDRAVRAQETWRARLVMKLGSHVYVVCICIP